MKPPTEPCVVCGKPSSAPLCWRGECLVSYKAMMAQARFDRKKAPKP